MIWLILFNGSVNQTATIGAMIQGEIVGCFGHLKFGFKEAATTFVALEQDSVAGHSWP